jgi:DNA (cytosine-5)-methyltransferase 1
MSKLSAIDLFSGCGGSAIGFNMAGFQIMAAIDVDENATKTYSQNFPNTNVITEDIRYISGKQLLKLIKLKKRQLSVLLACPPCQGFSSAKRKGSSYDPRNELVFEFVRLTKELLPKTIAMENVPGLSRGKGKLIFLEAIDQLNKMGYDTVYDILNSADYGVPQNRKRIILLGSRIKEIRLRLPEKCIKKENEKVTVFDAIGDLPKIENGKKHKNDPMHVAAKLSAINLERLMLTPHNGGSWKTWPDHLKLNCHRGENIGHSDVYGRMEWKKSAPTLTGGCTAISKGRFGHPEQNRAISLREAARLQSFPDSYNFMGSFTSITKQIGNAVPPLLAKNIAEEIKSMLIEKRKMDNIYRKLFSFGKCFN